MDLAHSLDRSIWIRAPREIVFGYFSDSVRWAAWRGAGSTIDARPGGALLIRYPNGTEVAGEVLAVAAPENCHLLCQRKGRPLPPAPPTPKAAVARSGVGACAWVIVACHG